MDDYELPKEYFTENANRQVFYGPLKKAECPDSNWVYFAGYGRKGDENLIYTLFSAQITFLDSLGT